MQRWLWCTVCAAAASGCTPGGHVDKAYREPAAAKFQVGHLAEAKTLFQQALWRNPADPFALYYLGRIACQEKDWETAIYYLQCCIDVDPRYTAARTYLAEAERAGGYTGKKLRFVPDWPASP